MGIGRSLSGTHGTSHSEMLSKRRALEFPGGLAHKERASEIFVFRVCAEALGAMAKPGERASHDGAAR